MTPGRRFAGLQVWLVAALVAVGVGASLAILLVVLPTLESSIRSDRAKQEAASLRRTLETSVREAMVEGPGVSDDLAELAQPDPRARPAPRCASSSATTASPGGRVRASTPEPQEILPHVAVTPGTSAILRDDRGVAAAIAAPVGFGTRHRDRRAAAHRRRPRAHRGAAAGDRGDDRGAAALVAWRASRSRGCSAAASAASRAPRR